MLLKRNALIDRLARHLESAGQIDVAVAWAGQCDALDHLRQFAKNGGKLRAVVGIFGNATEPSALRTLQKYGELRIATRVERLFHPKFYLFHGNGRRIGWVGSANLTRPGFQQNEELVFEFSDRDGKALKWFDDQWNGFGDDDDCDAILDEYQRKWKPPVFPPSSPGPNKTGVQEDEIYKEASRLTDWPSFVAGVAKADAYWGSVWRRALPVTGDNPSWLETITRGREVVRRDDWSVLSEDDRHVLLGRDPYGLLGAMGNARRANKIFRSTADPHLAVRRNIRKALQPVIKANDRIFAQKACDFVETVSGFEGLGGAVATRLLALARPDRAISVNGGSKPQLAILTGLPESSLAHTPHGRAKSYLDLLRWFEQQPWYASPAPQNAFEKLLASTRAALFDAFVYKTPR